MDRRIGERIHQARSAGKPKGGQYAWLGKIGVNEQDLNILLRRHGKRQVDSAEGLALARMRRANQNACAARKFLAVPACITQPHLPLYAAELLCTAAHRPTQKAQGWTICLAWQNRRQRAGLEHPSPPPWKAPG